MFLLGEIRKDKIKRYKAIITPQSCIFFSRNFNGPHILGKLREAHFHIYHCAKLFNHDHLTDTDRYTCYAQEIQIGPRNADSWVHSGPIFVLAVRNAADLNLPMHR